MSIWKDIVAITKKGFRLYPNNTDRAVKYINRKLTVMKIPQSVRNEILKKYHH